MDTTTLVLLIVAVLVVMAGAAAVRAARARRRTRELRGVFGAEYDRTVSAAGSRREAERALAQRRARYAALQLSELSEASRERYRTRWLSVQARFVDSPDAALTEADHLVTELMDERGLRARDVDGRAEVLSVEHGPVLADFRAGHDVEQQIATGQPTTEQVRQAMLHFRSVFEELVQAPSPGSVRRDAAP